MLKLPCLALVGCTLAISLGVGTLRGAAVAADGLPANLGHDLHALVAWQRAQAASQPETERKKALAEHIRGSASRLQQDAAGRVTVNLLLDGTVPASDVKKHVESLGATVIGEHAARRADRRDGILSVRLPVERAVEAAQSPGVYSVLSAHRPWRRTDPQLPAQGVPVLHVDQVLAAGTTGAGITVGVISDSYNVTSPSANLDVASGALPNNVAVLQDGDPRDKTNTDEGRAMLEIVHEVAPGATLAFNTSGDTQTTFADAIRTLRTNSTAPCDVIADDIAFPDEPFFSDGILSQAIDDVVTSTTLAGRPVIYYSASGNDGSNGYHANFDVISDQDVRSGNAGNNNLIFDNTSDPTKSVPESLTAGGFHNFKGADTGKGKQIVQTVTVSGGTVEIDLQWDDPFLPNGITTDYNLLVFDEDGTYEPDLSGTDDNFSTGEPLELVDLDANSDGSARTYQLVITLAAGGGANRLYYVPDGGTLAGKFLHTAQPTLFGHPAAANADGVGAFDVHTPTVPEDYDSFGPVEIVFDSMGNRLATPEVRLQPDISGVDGVDTTFFPEGSGNDSDGDGLPNFYGTSAAAPHAAAVAALMLQAAGGHGSLTAAQMRNLLESTAVDHDLDPAMSTATLTSPDGQEQVTITATGDDSTLSDDDSEFFKVTYSGPAGSYLKKLNFDLGPAGESFDTTASNGQPLIIGLAQGGLAKADIAAKPAAASGATLGLVASAGTFVPGALFTFGIGRDDSSGNPSPSADQLAGATVNVRCVLADGSKVKFSGAFANKFGHGYSPDVGYGLINAEAAFQSLTGK
jgi:hypothetical protein